MSATHYSEHRADEHHNSEEDTPEDLAVLLSS